MPTTLLVDAVGSCIAIDVSQLDEGDEAAVREAWADALADADAEPVDTVTPYGSARVHMLSSLSQQVTLAAIEAARGRAWMLHAAGVASPEGQVVVLVGPSGRGKTTASRALGAVYGYVSDETIAIDDDGRVWPYRKPLSVIEDPAAPKTQLPPSALGLQPVPDAELRVAAVVLLDRDPDGPEDPVIEQTDVGDALEDLISQTSFLHNQPAALRFITALATATGGIRTVRYREAATLPPVIASLMRPAAPIVVHPRPAHVVVPAAPEGPRFSRVEVADEAAVDDPDRIALLTIREHGQGHVTLLGGIAPAVWRASEGAGLPQLTEAATGEYGEPEGFDAGAAVLVAVGQLLDAGLLVSDEPLLARREDVAWVDSGDRIVVLPLTPEPDEKLAQPAALTGSAALIWEWLEESVTLTQLVARTIEVAGMDAAAEVPSQVQSFVADLVESRLVEARLVGEPAHVAESVSGAEPA
ncbi:ABC transporter ATP-binding protein [uncultured Microbacterium sp.]|uniref:ATP-binding cassette domain-containing protein n=1 Tax=uncultured Microbacterium sp. TaxID=191216 RepID=UPI0028D91079|nr:ABC transporter ATP-binding protein [uncultured Microbacterium sp.]